MSTTHPELFPEPAPTLDAETLATFERIKVLARERRPAYGRRVRQRKDTGRPSKAFPIYNPADRD